MLNSLWLFCRFSKKKVGYSPPNCINKQKGPGGWTALTCAADLGFEQCLRALLNADANVNGIDHK